MRERLGENFGEERVALGIGATVALVGLATFLGGGRADIPLDYEVHGTE